MAFKADRWPITDLETVPIFPCNTPATQCTLFVRLLISHRITNMVDDDIRTLLYFVQASSGPIKVGISDNPEKRLSAFQTAHYEGVWLVGYTRGDERMERFWHSRFGHLQMRREWFFPGKDLTDAAMSFLESGRGGGAINCDFLIHSEIDPKFRVDLRRREWRTKYGKTYTPPTDRRGFTNMRVASGMISSYGNDAAIEAQLRADRFLDEGDQIGKRGWSMIRYEIDRLQKLARRT